MDKCIVPGCERKMVASGFCSKHYQHQHKHGIGLLLDELIELSEVGDDSNFATQYKFLYWDTQRVNLPDYYNRDNIICQWLLSHHTKREFTPFKSRH